MISEELKAIVDKFKEQGKMNFFDETTEEKILAFEKKKKLHFHQSTKNGCCFLTEESCFFRQVFSYMELSISPL